MFTDVNPDENGPTPRKSGADADLRQFSMFKQDGDSPQNEPEADGPIDSLSEASFPPMTAARDRATEELGKPITHIETSSERTSLSGSLKETYSAMKESIKFVFEISPPLQRLKGLLAFSQSAQSLIYGVLAANLINKFSSSVSFTDPGLILSAGAMLGTKLLFDVVNGVSQSLDPVINSRTHARVQRVFKEEVPKSLEQRRVKSNTRDFGSVVWGVGGVVGAGTTVVQAVGNIAGAAVGATVLCWYAPWYVALPAIATACIPLLKIPALAGRVLELEREMAARRAEIGEITWSSTDSAKIQLLNTLGVRSAYEKLTDEERSIMEARYKEHARYVFKWDVGLNSLKFVGGLGTFAFLGHAMAQGATANGLDVSGAAFVAFTALPLLSSALETTARGWLASMEVAPVLKAMGNLRKVREREAVDEGRASIEWAGNGAEIKLDKVSFSHQAVSSNQAEVPIMQEISLTIEPGQFVVLLGENGSGKSTFLRLLDRAYRAKSGSIKINGAELSHLTLEEFCEGLAVNSQQNMELKPFTINQLLVLARGDKDQNAVLLEKLLDKTGLKDALTKEVARSDGSKGQKFPDYLETRLGSSVGGVDFSGGELALIYTTALLYKEPKLLLLDEPTSAMSEVNKAKYYKLLDGLKDMYGYKPTIVLVTHDHDRIQQADRVLFMGADGKGIVQDGTPRQVVEDKEGAFQKWRVEKGLGLLELSLDEKG